MQQLVKDDILKTIPEACIDGGQFEKKNSIPNHTTTGWDQLDAPEDSKTYERLLEKLRQYNMPFDKKHHRAVITCQDAAEVRQIDLKHGAKAILAMTKTPKKPVNSSAQPAKLIALFVFPASLRLDSKKVRQYLGYKSLMFASVEQVKEITGCLPGAVPPFGSLWDIPTYMDPRLRQVTFIDFNCGLRTASITMSQLDYEEMEKPIVFDLATEEAQT